MEELKRRINEEGFIINDEIVKVDHFINHMLDTKLLDEIGIELSKLFPDATKIVTIESSGIAFACITAIHMNHIPVVFAKKCNSRIMGDYVYKTIIHSYTKEQDNLVIVDKAYLNPSDKIIIIDDFLATGSALLGLSNIVKDSGATLLGCAVVIEKGFQKGRDLLQSKGVTVKSLANIVNIKEGKVVFDE